LVLLILLTTGTDIKLDVVLLVTSVIGAVVIVVPLYIIVTDGHMLSALIGPPYLEKQYWSSTGTADTAIAEAFINALLLLNRELAMEGRRRLVIARCYRVLAG
jgi:Flp pilus assembly protein protease CpaA